MKKVILFALVAVVFGNTAHASSWGGTQVAAQNGSSTASSTIVK